jgi:hypothetical protein
MLKQVEAQLHRLSSIQLIITVLYHDSDSAMTEPRGAGIHTDKHTRQVMKILHSRHPCASRAQPYTTYMHRRYSFAALHHYGWA